MYYRVVKNILLFLMLYLLSANTAFAQRDHLCLYSKDNTADKSWSLDVVRKIIFTQTDVAVYLWADDASYNVPYGNFRKFTFEGNKTVAVTGITLNKTTATLTEGETLALSATVSPDNATDKTLIWTSSDEAVATVKDGVVTAVKLGRATITAASMSNPSVSATCEVVVYSATGIGSVESDKNEKHDIYNLNGQRVTTMRKGGIYIVNARKVLAK